MPHLTFLNCSKEMVKELSMTMLPELSKALNCDAQRFTFNYQCHASFNNGVEITDELVFVEVKWLTRNQEDKDICADVISKNIHNYLSKKVQVIVTFQNIDPGVYYINGKHK